MKSRRKDGVFMKRMFGVFLAVILSIMLLTVVLTARQARADPQGWSKTYGGTSDDGASALVQTGDGGYALAGLTDSFDAGGWDFWLVKTDADGVIPEFTPSMILVTLITTVTLTAVLVKRKNRVSLTRAL